MAIVQMCSEEYRPLAELTVNQNKIPYCQKHGYEHFIQYVRSTNAKMAGYERFAYVRSFMERRDIDWFWIQGVDTMIMNFDIRMEGWVDKWAHLIIARDCYALNADSILIRNSDSSKELIDELLKTCFPYIWYAKYADSSALTDLYDRPELSYWKQFMKVVPQKSFNSADYTLYGMPELLGHEGQYTPGDFLLHWGGMSLERRLDLARKHLPLVQGR